MPDTQPLIPAESWQSLVSKITTAATPKATSDAAAAASAIGAAAGSAVIPVVGTALGALTAQLLFNVIGIKSKTQHLSWDEAESKATPYAVSVAQALQAQLSAAQLAQLALVFPNSYRSFVGNSDWWDSTTRRNYYDDYQSNIVTQPTDYDRVRQTVWEAAHWILENVDKANIHEAPDKLLFFYAQTLTPALVSLGLTDFVTQTVTTGGQPVVNTPAATPAKKTGLQLNVAGFSLWELLLIGGAALGVVWGLAHAKRGMR